MEAEKERRKREGDKSQTARALKRVNSVLLARRQRKVNQRRRYPNPISGNLHNKLFGEPTRELSGGFPTGFPEAAVGLISCGGSGGGGREGSDRMARSYKTPTNIPHRLLRPPTSDGPRGFVTNCQKFWFET